MELNQITSKELPQQANIFLYMTYLTARRQTLGHWWRWSLTHPILITVLLLSWARASEQGLDPNWTPSNSGGDVLYHCATLLKLCKVINKNTTKRTYYFIKYVDVFLASFFGNFEHIQCNIQFIISFQANAPFLFPLKTPKTWGFNPYRPMHFEKLT